MLLVTGLDQHDSVSNDMVRADFAEAVRFGWINTVRCLLDAGADANETVPKHPRTRMLNLAFPHRQAEVALLLIEADADIDFTDVAGNTPLMLACRTSDAGVASLPLRKAGRRAPRFLGGSVGVGDGLWFGPLGNRALVAAVLG